MLSPIEKVLFVLAVAVSLYFTYRGVRRIIAHISSGHGRPDWSLVWKRIGDLILKVGLFQPVFRLRPGPSILHGLIGWGFMTFLLINLADVIYAFTGFKLLENLGWFGNFYRLLADVAGVAIILGIEGTPQGGPLAPLLSNIVLDELDQELERRGHAFVRYADDCNIYVRSEAAGRRVMGSISGFIKRKLKLKVNQDKSAVDQPRRRKFLGFTFSEKKATVLISGRSLRRFRDRIRELTRRGVQALRMIGNLNTYLRGWVGYFGHAEDYWTLRDLDAWVRRRLRSLSWRAWRTPHKRFRELTRRGVPRTEAFRMVRFQRSPWHASRLRALHTALPDRLWHDRLHLLSLLREWRTMRTQS